MPRLFFGVEVADGARQRLAELCRDLRTLGVRAGNWSPPALYHVTSLFLGQLDEAVLPELEAIGQAAASHVAPWTITLNGAGTFLQKRILWAGVREDAGLAGLEALHRALRAQVAPRPWARLEERPYRAHLTLARQLDADTWTALEPRARALAERVTAGLAWPVEAFCLFESVRAGGRLTYPVRMRFPLCGR
ncbi:RNA 2',3'-cyclic phosphodiesterase [Alicyclobacillus macrosporangiidus]|uniref:RNA 2',3'-cyclic phosphodiesterase n=1 Tax=Alicyclobacillus macrosporangiidus TaxID=392015 RepID=A0A1I7FQW3_9BACL|nr:RNA 2',3'-cyclic phosphodiesterase [Alicyclobacillus macrosporangiidus]SFU38597.1 2'-5' RNA ligase [Alicyclobacillus macrosporangiidus]